MAASKPTPPKLTAAALALLVPVALCVGRYILSGQSLLADPVIPLYNWLFLAAPQLVALAIAAIIPRSRQRFLPLSLLLSAFVVAAFQCWIWYFVPPREGGAWILYIPLWIVALAVTAGALAWGKGRRVSVDAAN